MQAPVPPDNVSITTRVIRLVPEQPVRRISRPSLSVITGDGADANDPTSPPSAA